MKKGIIILATAMLAIMVPAITAQGQTRGLGIFKNRFKKENTELLP